MNARFFLTAAALLAAAPAIAEPAKPQAAAEQPRQVQVVLASAEPVAVPTPVQQASAPAKRPRVARVTTCRCGDPQQAQEQQNN